MATRHPTSSVNELKQKLANEEEWMKEFKEALSRNTVLTSSISEILDDFRYRITALSGNVSSLYSKTHVVQQEQQNVKKLLGIVDATIQFHGKTMNFDNTICDRNLLYNLTEHLEKMNNLKEAINFFSTHSTYQSQQEQMNQIFESGCDYMEEEFGTLVKSRSICMDTEKIFESLDEEYEIPNFRLATFLTIKEPQKLNQMANWFMINTPNRTKYLDLYATYRAENMLKVQRRILDQSTSASNFVVSAQRKAKKTQQLIKSAFKRATGKIGDKTVDISDYTAQKDPSIVASLILLSGTLALIQLETKICASVFANVRVEADVLRRTITTPLQNAVTNVNKTIDNYESTFEAMIPLVKFLIKHTNEIGSLCENIGEAMLFARVKTCIKQRGVQLITDFIDRLSNDHNRFVPADGNVHHITSTTLNLLRLLVENRPIVSYIYDETILTPISGGAISAAPNSSRIYLSKLFAQMLSALGVNLKNKAATYSDNTLGALFMFNNLSYISLSCARDKSLMSILDASNGQQLLSFYQSEIDDYLERYLQSWSKMASILSDRRSSRVVYANFNKEFDSIIDAQRNYCLVDLSLAHDIRKRIKELVLKPYAEFSARNAREPDLDLDRQQIKYDAESIELIIDRLFDVPF